ncbi:MAG: hypothetical protein ACK4VM_11780, partial [Bosea sp. (in: a-proteobacteria)]
MRDKPTRRSVVAFGSAALVAAGLPRSAASQTRPDFLIDSPYLKAEVEAGRIPVVDMRVPLRPRIVTLAGEGRAPGRHGGTLRMLMGDQRDIRMMTLYGYTRLV